MPQMGLPQELLLQIIEHLDRNTLKNFRLTNKFSCDFATAKLFQTVHLTPNTRSFDRARAIASAPHLSHHVKAVVFHVGILQDFHSGFEHFKKYIIEQHQLSGTADEIMGNTLWKYNCFLEEIEGQNDFEARDEDEELRSVCQGLNMLESITTILDEYNPFIPPSDFIGQRTGCQSVCSADGPHFSSLFNAVTGKSLTRVNGGSMSWCYMEYIVLDSLDVVDLQNIKYLSLGLFNSEYVELAAPEQESALSALKAFLDKFASSGGLQELRLDFDEIPLEDIREELVDISGVVLETHWPSLRALSLQGIVATEGELVEFLVSHAGTLRTLHLDDIDLLAEAEYDGKGNWLPNEGSVLSLFSQINKTLRLESAHISGNFTNRNGEGWCANPEVLGRDCLRRRIELWLSCQGQSPFPDEILQRKSVLSHPNAGTWSLSDGFINGQIDLGPLERYADESWQWDVDLASWEQ